MENRLRAKYILDSQGRLTDYGLMLLARLDEEALAGLTIDMGKEVENKVRETLSRCDLAYYKDSTHADEVRQRLYVRMLSVYKDKFDFHRYRYSDSFYVEGWEHMDKGKLLVEYLKYLERREDRG